MCIFFPTRPTHPSGPYIFPYANHPVCVCLFLSETFFFSNAFFRAYFQLVLLSTLLSKYARHHRMPSISLSFFLLNFCLNLQFFFHFPFFFRIKAIRCTMPACPCECFLPGKLQLRQCQTCKHGWVPHGKSFHNPFILIGRESKLKFYWEWHFIRNAIKSLIKKWTEWKIIIEWKCPSWLWIVGATYGQDGNYGTVSGRRIQWWLGIRLTRKRTHVNQWEGR